MSSVDGISTTTSESATNYLDRIPKQTLGQDDFLQLLVTQLTQQDPMSPKSDSEFISQMASFSSLEQTKLMLTDISAMRVDQELLQANSLLGRMVTLRAGSKEETTGLVSAVHVEAGTPKVEVDGVRYDLKDISVIVPTLVSEPETTD
ncbi:MAG: flagellar hook assembly protein FlgD [Verrucomicrobiales bacterium]|jgi:flagellar basal-body rod modification protein FlgD|nr:flagellar hook assembly protein FlgD [Verrucomicrobiales bacterium]